MKITIEITPQQIADLMTTAIESGDPVTTARRGGWCNGINWKRRKGGEGLWYNRAKTWSGDILIEIIEVDDETTGHETKHLINGARIAKGLGIMASKYGHLFEQITGDNVDAPCADIFLQCVVFGEEKYA